MLTLDHVGKKVRDAFLFQNVSGHVHPESVTVVLGPSGCGKTTLMRCLIGLDSFTQGRVLWDGEPIPPHQYIHNMGMIFQQFALFSHMTAMENICYAPSLRHLLSEKEQKTEAEHWLEQLGVIEQKNHYPHQLSGGQKQRVAIARALILKPKVLIFDEPTSALDPKSVILVERVIKNLKTQGISILVVSHDIEFAMNIADYLWFMHQGELLSPLSMCDLQDHLIHPAIRSFLSKEEPYEN
jgi:ABC-type polar amino acid transport system ATPase subunit